MEPWQLVLFIKIMLIFSRIVGASVGKPGKSQTPPDYRTSKQIFYMGMEQHPPYTARYSTSFPTAHCPTMKLWTSQHRWPRPTSPALLGQSVTWQAIQCNCPRWLSVVVIT